MKGMLSLLLCLLLLLSAATAAKAQPRVEPAASETAIDRYTRRDPGTLYAHVFDRPPSGELQIPSVRAQLIEASLLTSGGDVALRFEHTDAGVTVQLPEQTPDETASVVRIEFEDAWESGD